MTKKQVIQLINNYWNFDNDQDNLSSWHDKQDLINEIEKLTLTDVGCSLPTKEDDTEYWIDLVNWESGGIEEVSNTNLLKFKNDINLEIQKRLKQ